MTIFQGKVVHSLKNFFFFNFWLCWVFIVARGLSLVATSRGYSLVAVLLLLIAVISLVAHGLSCSEAYGLFPNQELNP